jgi:ATP-dependent Zn protease
MRDRQARWARVGDVDSEIARGCSDEALTVFDRKRLSSRARLADSKNMGNAGKALFPLLVIVLLVYLASQTLLGPDDRGGRIAYGDLITKVERSPQTVESVRFIPKSNGIRVTLRNGKTLTSNYPTEASQLEFQHLLRDRNVHFESSGTGNSAWWSMLTYLLPFALFFGFWIFLMRQGQTSRRAEEPGSRPDAREAESGG